MTHTCKIKHCIIQKINISQFGQVVDHGYRCKCDNCGFVSYGSESENTAMLDWFDGELHMEDELFDVCEVVSSRPFGG